MKQHYLVRWDEDEFGQRKYQYGNNQQLRKQRYGFHLKCTKCKYRINSGGIETLKQSYAGYLSYEKIHSEFCNHPLTVTRDYHSTELGHTFVEQTTNQTHTGDTTLTDISGAVISNTNLTAGKKYLLVFTAQITYSSTSSDSRTLIAHGSTTFDDGQYKFEPDTAGTRETFFWYTVWTAVSTEDIIMRFQSAFAGHTIEADQITMLAIKLSDDLTENTDWAFNENLTDTTLAATYGTANSATLTMTPNGTDDILVLATAQLDPTSLTVPQKTRINASGGVTDTGVEWIQEGEDATDDLMLQTLVKVYTPSASSTTFTTESESSSNTGTRNYNSVFWLNLNKLRNHAFQATAAEINLDTTDTFSTSTQVATVSLTPNITGDVWCLGFFINDKDAREDIRARMQIDNTDQPGTQTSDNYVALNAWDVTDEIGWAIQSIENLSNASHTLDVDATKVTTARPVEDRLAMMVTMELASAGVTVAQYMNALEPYKYKQYIPEWRNDKRLPLLNAKENPKYTAWSFLVKKLASFSSATNLYIYKQYEPVWIRDHKQDKREKRVTPKYDAWFNLIKLLRKEIYRLDYKLYIPEWIKKRKQEKHGHPTNPKYNAWVNLINLLRKEIPRPLKVLRIRKPVNLPTHKYTMWVNLINLLKRPIKTQPRVIRKRDPVIRPNPEYDSWQAFFAVVTAPIRDYVWEFYHRYLPTQIRKDKIQIIRTPVNPKYSSWQFLFNLLRIQKIKPKPHIVKHEPVNRPTPKYSAWENLIGLLKIYIIKPIPYIVKRDPILRPNPLFTAWQAIIQVVVATRIVIGKMKRLLRI